MFNIFYKINYFKRIIFLVLFSTLNYTAQANEIKFEETDDLVSNEMCTSVLENGKFIGMVIVPDKPKKFSEIRRIIYKNDLYVVEFKYRRKGNLLNKKWIVSVNCSRLKKIN